MRKTLTILLAALTLCACNNIEMDENLLDEACISLSIKGKVIYTFNSLEGQASYNPDGTLYRYSDDNLKNWFELKTQSRPTRIGKTITADLRWSTRTSDGDETDLEFTIRKTEDDGTIWLWNSSKNIGLIIKDY